MEEIHPLMVRAGALCKETHFAAADSIYRYLLPQINSISSDSIVDEYISDIVTIYSTIMPDSVSVPEEITLQVFQQQMLQSFDSLPYSAKDSALVSRLISRSNVKHDIPIVWNSRVEKSLFFYITRNQATIEYWKKRASIYLPFMKKMFADSSLPQDLAYLPLIESGFNPKAYSRSHASGIWQFIPSTGRLYGLRNNYWIDERRDPVRSTTAAIAYLKKLYGDFGNWYLALAAYNCGEGGLSRAIERCETSDYWQLRLPPETMNYVPHFLAAITIAKDQDFITASGVLPDNIPFDTVFVSDCIDMREIAAGIGIAFDTLKTLNPHILHWCTPPDMSSVRLYLPSGMAPAFKKFYDQLPDDKKVRWYRYRVQPGDNLGSIARHFKLPVEGIKTVNKLNGCRIIAGHYLFIPIPVGKANYSMPAEVEQPVAKSAGQEKAPAGASLIVYEVKSGDTVWKLAELFGVNAKQICGWNNIKNSNIRAGQVLSIYTKSHHAASQVKTGTRNAGTHRATSSYVVCQGDNPFRISRMFKMSMDELYALNEIDPADPVIHPGDTIQVRKNDAGSFEPRRPEKQSDAEPMIKYVVTTGDNLYRIAQNFTVSAEAICKLNHIGESAMLHEGDTLFIPSGESGIIKSANLAKHAEFYTVKNGDNLWTIANLFGIPVEHLYEYNGLQYDSVLMPGDTIRFSKKDDL